MPLAKRKLHKVRHTGARWIVVYGSNDGVERFALAELQRIVQRRLPYVIEVHDSPKRAHLRRHHVIVLGTPANNPCIAELVKKKCLTVPRRKEGYTVACLPSPWGKGRKVVVIAGNDAAGALYGVEDFSARMDDNATLVGRDINTEHSEWTREALDGLPEFAWSESPAIENRGIWSWGYVIHDYRRFFDNMARLRMNMITIWNDCPPINCPEVIEYAHSRGIRVVLGFPWGWGFTGLNLSKRADREALKESVLADYRQNYRHLDHDGIYFQTLTEHASTRLGGRSVAAWTCMLVNDIAGALFEEQPDLYIQFGLHATSIQNDYRDLKALDPRVVITWEDAGVIPYAYDPVTWHDDNPMSGKIESLGSPAKTIQYSKRLATLREGVEFAMVPKGWLCLRWLNEFEHHGPFILGERDPAFIRQRLQARQPIWDRVNTLWTRNYPLAAKFYRDILACRPSRMTVTGLVDDGLLEEAIQPSVAIFAETIWNPHRSDTEILQRAMSPYYGKDQV